MFTDHESPRMVYYRGSTNKNGHFFGPYPNAWAVRDTMQLLQKIFRLRTCEDSVFSNRSRPCLLYQIQRCSAPCVALISKEEYQAEVEHAVKILHGESKEVLGNLEDKMLEASNKLQFERAAMFRDQMKSLASLMQQQAMESSDESDVDNREWEVSRTFLRISTVMNLVRYLPPLWPVTISNINCLR